MDHVLDAEPEAVRDRTVLTCVPLGADLLFYVMLNRDTSLAPKALQNDGDDNELRQPTQLPGKAVDYYNLTN